MIFRTSTLLLLVLVLFFQVGCSIKQPDYTLYREHFPKSILVIPPINETAEVSATNLYLATISEAVGEQGYYLFPVALVDSMLRENGVVGPIEARQVSNTKLREIFGADAVLDATIKEWGTRYLFLSSETRVVVAFKLIDLKTGSLLWEGQGFSVDQSGGGSDLSVQLVSALVHAVSRASSDVEVRLAREANRAILRHEKIGLLPGPRAPLPPEA